MQEDSYLRVERQYFAETYEGKLGVPEKLINKILKMYNEFLQKALLGESLYVVEDLRKTLVKARRINGAAGTEDSRSG